MQAVVARKTWRTLEPLHAMIYFAPEAQRRYSELGLDSGAGYFASRSAALGRASAELVIATFFNFCPDLVRAHIPSAWSTAGPDQVLAARWEAADAALRRALGDVVSSVELAEAAGLARRAAEAATARPEGRPLFAAHAALDWPDPTHLALFHAQTLLREFRGDAHVALLVSEGFDAVGALVLHQATGELPPGVLQATRAWPEAAWRAGVDALAGRGLITADGSALTARGREVRQALEDRTDQLSLPAYRALGAEGCDRLRQLGRPLSQAVVAAGLLPAALARTVPAD